MKQLAPIGIGTYNRLSHLKKTINALKNNILSMESELYIFSDGAKDGDEEMVHKLRVYLHTIDGFKKIYIIQRATNLGPLLNHGKGMDFLLEKYGKFIYLEDDIVSASGFLRFMNDALDLYEDRENIHSISGYTPSIKNSIKFEEDGFIFQRFTGWGMGTWKDKFYKVKRIDKNDYLKFINNPKTVQKAIENSGGNILKEFKDDAYRKNNYYDVQATFLEYQENSYTLYPKQSLVLNIGHDGTGQQSGVTKKFDVTLWDKNTNFILSKEVSPNVEIVKEMALFHSPNENDIDISVVNTIVNEIENLNLKSLNIWGLGVLSTQIQKQLNKKNISINYFIDTWASGDEYHDNIAIITPQEALKKDEKNFVIASIGSRYKMKDSIDKMTEKKLNIIMFN